LVNISFAFAFKRIMKKFLTIPLALLILISGMHFTVATHYCGGHIAATKLSLTGKLATCGMTSGHDSENSSETQISSKCCDDKIAVYKVDNDYSPAAFHFNNISQNIHPEFFIPRGFLFHSQISLLTIPTNVSPPDCFAANAVRMADICVFRI
jgi:hypothetical protein